MTSRSPRSMGKYFKNDEEQPNADDRMDDDIHDTEIEDDENEYERNHSHDDWFHKKSHLNDDFPEIEIEF